MTRLLVAVIAASAVVLGAGVAPWAASAALLPLALIAGWGVVRGANEVMLAVPAFAISLGVASEERVGWFILAAVPLLLVLTTVAPSEERSRSVAVAAGVAWIGYAAFGFVLLLAAGRIRALPAEVLPLAGASCVAALLAGIGVIALWPWRRRAPRLFA